MTEFATKADIEGLRLELLLLKPYLQSLLIELKNQARQDWDNKDFILAEFRHIVHSIKLMTEQLERLAPTNG